MRTAILSVVAVVMLAACGDNLGTTEQEVAGPTGVMVTPRAVDQLAVSWSAVPPATKYYVFQSIAGGALTFAASVLDSSGAPPPTSWIATGVAAGMAYCFAVSAAFSDGSESDLSAVACWSGPMPHSATLVIPASAGRPAGASGASLSPAGDRFVASRAGDVVAFPIALPVGSRISNVDIWYLRSGGTPFYALMKQVLSTGATSMISSTADGTSTSLTVRTIGSIDYDTLATEQYWLLWTAGAAGDDIRAIVLH